jgi:hypothetical protein
MFYIIVILAGILGVPAKADETVKFRSIYHATSVQSQDVGDVDGHILSVVRISGLASFPDGSVAVDSSVGTSDYVKGSGPLSVYGSLTFNDGSVLWYKENGTATVQGTNTNFKGTTTILGGKGRFEGAKGDGSFTATRVQATLATGAVVYSDVVVNIKK